MSTLFGLYIIRKGEEPEPVLDAYSHKPLVYDSGDIAAYYAAVIGLGHYAILVDGEPKCAEIKVQPRPIKDDAWHAREIQRLADGTYTALPWTDLPARDATTFHYPHVSTEDGAKIAYTQDDEKGARDIQTRIKPGKYLAQFYGDVFDAPTIARMSTEFSMTYGEKIELQFATTEDEIEHVYVNGPHSCMQYEADHFSSSIHPCRIYAAGDLAVAYIMRDDRITARCLVWPEKKLAGRMYGDETRLQDALEDAGYTGFDGDCLDGARMLRIKEKNAFVCPYIDGSQSVGDNGEYLILGGGGINGGSQYGLTKQQCQCCSCNELIDEDDAYCEDDRYYCSECHSEEYWYCDHYNEPCPREGMEEVIVRSNGRTQNWSEAAIRAGASRCEGTGALYADELIVTLADGTVWSQWYYEDNGGYCEATEEHYSLDDLIRLKDGRMWCFDYFNEHGVTVDGENYAKGDEPVAEEEVEQEAA